MISSWNVNAQVDELIIAGVLRRVRYNLGLANDTDVEHSTVRRVDGVNAPRFTPCQPIRPAITRSARVDGRKGTDIAPSALDQSPHIMFTSQSTGVLVVEDDGTMQQLLVESLRPLYTVYTTASWPQAIDIVAAHDVKIVVADARLAFTNGPDLDTLHVRTTDVPVLFVAHSADGTLDHELRRACAPLFVGKPLAAADLPRAVEDLLTERSLAQELRRQHLSGGEANGILAESRTMQQVISLIDRAARRDTPVLLVGDSGTGKELLARALHKLSPRAHGPFVAVNCSAIPETLLENELFGHRRGAFTDARDDQRGLFHTAHRGTIFLDEIGDMAPALQGKLLRVLQEKEVHPLGRPRAPADVRTVTATHRDLDALVADGRFRQDLPSNQRHRSARAAAARPT